MGDFESLYAEMLPVVYRYLAFRAGSATAEELTGEVFCAAVRSLQTDGTTTITAAWIMAVAKNKLVDHWRQLERRSRLSYLTAHASQQMADDSAESIALDTFSVALETLEQLPERYRILLTLRYIDDMEVAEVARITETSESAAESALARARQAFRAAYVGVS